MESTIFKFVFVSGVGCFFFAVAFNKRLRQRAARSWRGYNEEEKETIEAVTMAVAAIAGMFSLALAVSMLITRG